MKGHHLIDPAELQRGVRRLRAENRRLVRSFTPPPKMPVGPAIWLDDWDEYPWRHSRLIVALLHSYYDELRGALRRDPCAYCGEPSEHLDHITPRSRGGDDTVFNLTAACKACNSTKGTRSLLAYLGRRQAMADTRAWGEVR